MTYCRCFGPRTTGIICLPRNSPPFFSARQRLRLALTSRIPTVICVGRRSKMATGSSRGSRTTVMFDSRWFDTPVRVLSTWFWDELVSSFFIYSPGRRVAGIVELIMHAKSTDAADVCPALLKGEEPTICAAATITRILGAPWIRVVGQIVSAGWRLRQHYRHQHKSDHNFGFKARQHGKRAFSSSGHDRTSFPVCVVETQTQASVPVRRERRDLQRDFARL